MKLSNFKQVAEYQLCCGCGLCAYLNPGKIQMVDCLNHGRRPQLKPNSEWKLCTGIDQCPGITLDRKFLKTPPQNCIDFLYDEWGPVLKVYEGHAVDKDIRFRGSSGGGITALSLYCLEQQSFSGVLHVVANQDSPALNTTRFSKNRDELIAGVGSRYSPASPCEKLYKVENADKRSVVVGKPCDIAATVMNQDVKKTINDKIGLTIACFCAGTPSTNGTYEMLRQMNMSPNLLSHLKYRGGGWPGMTEAQDLDQNKVELTYDQSWGDILQKYRQWRCYICPDHAGEFADIAVGDPWYKEVEEGDIGQSLIIVRTQRGAEIVEGAIASGYLNAWEVSPKLLPQSQMNLKKTRANLWGRLVALKLTSTPYPKYTNFDLYSSWLKSLTFKEKVKSVLGTVKRVYVKKLGKKQNLFPILNKE